MKKLKDEKRRVDRSISYWKTYPELSKDEKLEGFVKKFGYDIRQIRNILQKTYDPKTRVFHMAKRLAIDLFIRKQYQEAIDALKAITEKEQYKTGENINRDIQKDIEKLTKCKIKREKIQPRNYKPWASYKSAPEMINNQALALYNYFREKCPKGSLKDQTLYMMIAAFLKNYYFHENKTPITIDAKMVKNFCENAMRKK